MSDAHDYTKELLIPRDPAELKAFAERDPEAAKQMLAKLSCLEPIKTKKSDTSSYLENLSHPQWISDTKRIHQNMITSGFAKKNEIIEPPKPVKKVEKLENFFIFEVVVNEIDKEILQKYPFYANVKKIMYANGDKLDCNHETIVLIHDYVAKLISILTEEKTLKNYLESEKKFGLKSQNSVKKKTGRYKKMLEKLFPRDYSKYFQFDKMNSKYKLQINQEVVAAAQLEEEKEGEHFNSSDESNGEDLNIIESNIKDNEKSEFIIKRSENMSGEDYIYFTDCRSVQFQTDSRDKFLELLNLSQRGLEFLERNKTIVDFMSYLMTKCIGGIVENVLRSHNAGRLETIKDPIKPEDADKEIKKSIEHIKVNLRKIMKDGVSIEEIAFKLFLKEETIINKIDFEQPKKVQKKEKNEDSPHSSRGNSPSKLEEDDNEEKSGMLEEIRKKWRTLNSNTKKLWTARVIAEKQIKEQLKVGGRIDDLFLIEPINSYAEYLINNFEHIKKKGSINDGLFRKLFACYQNYQPIMGVLPEEDEIEVGNGFAKDPQLMGKDEKVASEKTPTKENDILVPKPIEPETKEAENIPTPAPKKPPRGKRRLGSMLD